MTAVQHPNATIPDSVEVPRVGALQYELGFPTPETSQKLFDEMDFQRAVQAYLWGYPAVSFESIRLTAKQDLGMDFNDLGIADNFVDPKSVWLTANDTTIYAFVNIDLTQGPVVIEIPPGAIVGLLDDFWQRSLADVGLPGPDAGNGGTFLLLPPGYDGEVPASGYYVLQATMNNHNLLVRGIIVDNDVPDAVAAHPEDEGLPVERARGPQAEQVRLDLGQADRHDPTGRHRVLGAARLRSSTTTPSRSTTASSWPCSSRWASRRASRSSLTPGRRPSSRRPPRSAMRWHAT